MKNLTTARRITICAICISLCYVLPLAFHSLGLGSTLSPMHIPVLLCGLLCGGGSGLLCGILGPLLSSLLSGMPPLVKLLRMIPELCGYGLAGGIAMKHIRTGSISRDVYCSLLVAMVAGRILGGIASAVFFTVTTGVYSLSLWIGSYFLEGLAGIAVHLVLVPALYLALQKARLIPRRYPTQQ